MGLSHFRRFPIKEDTKNLTGALILMLWTIQQLVGPRGRWREIKKYLLLASQNCAMAGMKAKDGRRKEFIFTFPATHLD